MPATKRVPVSEEIWKRLGELKGAGQTYDDLLEELMQSYNGQKLIERMERRKREEMTPLDEL